MCNSNFLLYKKQILGMNLNQVPGPKVLDWLQSVVLMVMLGEGVQKFKIIIIPPANEVWGEGYWFHPVRPSVCLTPVGGHDFSIFTL